jgi:hypothetical protein
LSKRLGPSFATQLKSLLGVLQAPVVFEKPSLRQPFKSRGKKKKFSNNKKKSPRFGG